MKYELNHLECKTINGNTVYLTEVDESKKYCIEGYFYGDYYDEIHELSWTDQGINNKDREFDLDLGTLIKK